MNYKILIFLLSIQFSLAQTTGEDFYKLAKDRLEKSGPSHVVKSDIDKAIMMNHDNLDYRYIRVRCNMASSSTEINLREAIKDLEFIISKDLNAKYMATLGLAHYHLARELYQFKKEPGHREALENFELSNKAYFKALELNPNLKLTLALKIEENENKIKQIK